MGSQCLYTHLAVVACDHDCLLPARCRHSDNRTCRPLLWGTINLWKNYSRGTTGNATAGYCAVLLHAIGVGGALRPTMPCTCLHTLWISVPRLIVSVGLTMTATNTVADIYGKVRNWQSTHSCSVILASVMCPGQSWWLSHCGHSAVLNGLSVWVWSDATSNIGRYTANSINPAICRLSRCFILFYLGPLLQRWPNFSGANIRIFLHNCKYYIKKRKRKTKNPLPVFSMEGANTSVASINSPSGY